MLDYDGLSERYGIPFVGSELVQRGVNRVYRVKSSNGVCFVRVSSAEARALSAVIFELDTLHHYDNSSDVRVARPIRTVDGALYVIDNQDSERCLVSVFEQANGVSPEPSIDTYDRLGHSLAVLHNGLRCAAGRAPVALIPDDLYMSYANLSREADGVPRAVAALLQSMSRRIANDLLEVNGQLSKGVCHGDVWLRNVHFSDRLVTFFDFEHCGTGPLIFDIATSAFWLESDPQYQVGRLEAMVNGYRQAGFLSQHDVEALPVFVVANALRVTAFLARYRLLSSAQWAEHLSRTERLFDRYLNGQLST